MTFRGAVTVTPEGYIDQGTGNMVYEDFAIESSNYKEDAHKQLAYDYENSFVEDEEGNQHYQPTTDLSSDDIDYFQSLVGGADSYQEMVQWAGQNLDAEDIAEYDRIMDSGDLALMQSLVYQLQERYENRSDGTESAQELERIYNYANENFDDETWHQFEQIMQNGDQQMKLDTIRLISQQMQTY